MAIAKFIDGDLWIPVELDVLGIPVDLIQVDQHMIYPGQYVDAGLMNLTQYIRDQKAKK